MITHYVFRIDEHHIGLEVNKTYMDDCRFPIEMIVRGEKYNGLESTLNKPHGKKMIMEFILNMLFNGPKQYKSFVGQVIKKFTWLDLNDALESNIQLFI